MDPDRVKYKPLPSRSGFFMHIFRTFEIINDPAHV